MSEFLIYLLKVNSCFAILYIAFLLFFRKLTFHKTNRAILLAIIPLSIIIPLLRISSDYLVPVDIDQLTSLNFIESNMEHVNSIISTSSTSLILSSWNILAFFYWVGFALFSIRLFQSIYQLVILKKRSTIVVEEGFYFLKADVPTIFSCFNWIFIPKEKTRNYENPIIEHEKAHARLKHTLDLIAIEIYSVLCWFNPFVYFYKKSIRSIHEFQADEAILKMQVEKSVYLKILLKQITHRHNDKLYSYFNAPTTQSRVEMIVKPESKKMFSLSYLLLLPILSILFFAFVAPSSDSFFDTKNAALSFDNNTPVFVFPVLNHSVKDISAAFDIEGKHPVSKKIERHGGIDIHTAEGTSVIAAAAGKVSLATFKTDWGNYVVLTHPNGYQSWYAHLKDFIIKENQTIKQGELIGYVGDTGLAKGHHLHFEIRHNGKRLNPLDLLEP